MKARHKYLSLMQTPHHKFDDIQAIIYQVFFYSISFLLRSSIVTNIFFYSLSPKIDIWIS